MNWFSNFLSFKFLTFFFQSFLFKKALFNQNIGSKCDSNLAPKQAPNRFHLPAEGGGPRPVRKGHQCPAAIRCGTGRGARGGLSGERGGHPVTFGSFERRVFLFFLQKKNQDLKEWTLEAHHFSGGKFSGQVGELRHKKVRFLQIEKRELRHREDEKPEKSEKPEKRKRGT